MPTSDLERRKAEHEALRQFVNEHGGAVESVAGDFTTRVSCRVGSDLPARLRAIGYDVHFAEKVPENKSERDRHLSAADARRRARGCRAQLAGHTGSQPSSHRAARDFHGERQARAARE